MSEMVLSGFSVNGTTNVDINESNNARVKRQARNKKKKKKDRNNRNIRKNTNKNNKSQTSNKNTCLNTGMNWRNYQSFTTISR